MFHVLASTGFTCQGGQVRQNCVYLPSEPKAGNAFDLLAGTVPLIFEAIHKYIRRS